MTGDSPFRVRNPEFEAVVRESFDRQTIMQTFGARLDSVEPGRVSIAMPFSTDFAQQHGFLHAGALATVLDSACGYAALTLMEPGSGVLSVEFKINMLAPAKGSELVATSSVVRSGRTITVCEARGVMRDGDTETLVASMAGTMMRIGDRPGISG